MSDLLEAIKLMLPDLTTTPTYSVFKQMFDTSDITMAGELFFIKAFNKKLMELINVETMKGETMTMTPMARRVDKAVDILAESLRVSSVANHPHSTQHTNPQLNPSTFKHHSWT